MSRNRTIPVQTAADRRLAYVSNAAWYWFKAATEQEHLASAMHRTLATACKVNLERYGEPIPSDEEVLNHAKQLFPEDRLHQVLSEGHDPEVPD